MSLIGLGTWFAALFSFLAWVTPPAYGKYKKRKIKQGIDVSGVELSGVVASDEHQGRVVPFWNIKVNVVNDSTYPVDVRSRVYIEGNEVSKGGFQSTTTRGALRHVFTLNAADDARCFFARLMPNIPEKARNKNAIADPHEYIRSAPPSVETGAWIEFVGEIPPNTTGGAWTAQTGGSIDVHDDKTIGVEILSEEETVLASFFTTTAELLNLAKEAEWSNIGEVKAPDVVSTTKVHIQEISRDE